MGAKYDRAEIDISPFPADGNYWHRTFAMDKCAVQSLNQQASLRADVKKRRIRQDQGVSLVLFRIPLVP